MDATEIEVARKAFETVSNEMILTVRQFGSGGWSYALQLAGWPEDEPVWTGSCPCQPFSAAGKGKGTDDERHLWPEFFRLICELKPAIVFGEQVASKAGRERDGHPHHGG